MITPDFSQAEFSLIRDSIHWFEENFLPQRHKLLLEHISGLSHVSEFSVLHSILDRINKNFTRSQRFILNVGDEGEAPPRRRTMELDEDVLPLLKCIILENRRYEAERVERAIAKTHNADLIKKFESELTPYDDLLQLPWLREVSPHKLPRVADFLSVQIIASQANGQRPVREYDEKFHILQAPKLILEDLRYYRSLCGTRDVSVTVAYIDIDDFKILRD
jgi:hypothetical protein